jgi:two-component system, chemotaxis family, sensor kinase CheA
VFAPLRIQVTEDWEIIREFLVESNDNLSRLDREMVELEQHPEDRELLGSIFRTIHTIKGTCGFLGFSRLEKLTHGAEDILSQLRSGERRLDTPLANLILETVDAVKQILASIEADAGEGQPFEAGLIARLEKARERSPADAAPQPKPAEAAPQAAIAATVGAAPAESAAPGGPAAADTSLRVDVGLLERLMNLAGELVLTRNQLAQYQAARQDAALNAIAQRLNLITSELQEGVTKTRMQPIGLVWNKFPRVVRDLSTSLHKEIALEMDGADTELDRTILEAIKDPLTHIVRNSCDHGIEEPARRLAAGKPARGRLALRAFHEGGHVIIEITDDGAGIDPQRVKAKAVERGLLSAEQAQRTPDRDATNLVFLPGFSTAGQVTSISGRGVGMDVVRTHVERIGGAVDLTSEPGRGTTIRVRIPLTLAIIPGLVVLAGGERFVIPQASLHELIRLEGDAAHARIERLYTAPVYRCREALLPLADLCSIFHLAPQRAAGVTCIAVVQADEQRFGLIVDAISDSQEIVVKPLGRQLRGLNCYAGAAIMGDGRIALILDVPGMGSRAGMIAATGPGDRGGSKPLAGVAGNGGTKSLLLFRAGGHERLAMPLFQVARLERIPGDKVEHAAGQAVVQYRGRILPLISLAEMFGGVGMERGELLQVVVYDNRGSELGLVVDEFQDIVQEEVTNRQACDHPALLGSALVGGRVTDFLDLEAVVRRASIAPSESLERLEAALADVSCRTREAVR